MAGGGEAGSASKVDLEAQEVDANDCLDWVNEGSCAPAGKTGDASCAAGAAAGAAGETSEDGAADPDLAKGQGVMASVWNTGIALPSLIGTWCWPLVFAWIFMIAWYNVPLGLTMLFYALEFALMSVVCTNVFQYAHWLNAKRVHKDDNAVRLIGWSIPLNLLFPFAVCVIYIGGYGMPEYKMWTDGSFTPNTPFGVTLWILKWIGFVMLTVGLVRITNLHKKVARTYNESRTGTGKKTTKLAQSSSA